MTVKGIQRRVAALLSSSPRREAAVGTLPVYYDYRASPVGDVDLRLLFDGVDMEYQLYTMAVNHVSLAEAEPSLRCRIPLVKRGDLLRVSLTEPAAWLNGVLLVADFALRRQVRRFGSQFSLSVAGIRQQRLCSHYLPFENKLIGSDYYFGDDYGDYPRQTGTSDGLTLVKRHCADGRLLDIGCALGLYTKAFLDAGFDAYGMDVSAFAVAEAGRRVGLERVRCANLDTENIPFFGRFDIFWLWDVLEHFAAPKDALEKITQVAAPGALMFLHTSNADSLTHHLFGRDWEGYTDYSHKAVDLVSCKALRDWLTAFGWELLDFQCSGAWIRGADPVWAQVRKVLESAAFENILAGREQGDFIRVVCRRRTA